MSSPSAVAAQPGTRELTLSQAVNEALAEEMRRDASVFIVGEESAETFAMAVLRLSIHFRHDVRLQHRAVDWQSS